MRPGKRNGFSLPLHRLQILSWVIVATLTSLFYSVVGTALNRTVKIAVFSIYTVAFALSFGFGLWCTVWDPTDIAVKMRYTQKNYAYQFNSSQFPRLCTRCNTHVGALSKHCNKCNRCTAFFDHHCDWLNNCIGAGNYRLFILLLVTQEVWVSLQLAVTVYCMVLIFCGEGDFLLTKYSIKDRGYCYLVMLMTTGVTCVIVALGTGYLVAFHAWLRAKGMTTYEFIVNRRKGSKVEQCPQSQLSPRKSENSSIAVELNVSGPEPRGDHTPEDLDRNEASASFSSDLPVKQPLARTIDNSSLPSYQDKPTELDSSYVARQRNMRETAICEEEEKPSPDGSPIRYRTGPLPQRSDFP